MLRNFLTIVARMYQHILKSEEKSFLHYVEIFYFAHCFCGYIIIIFEIRVKFRIQRGVTCLCLQNLNFRLYLTWYGKYRPSGSRYCGQLTMNQNMAPTFFSFLDIILTIFKVKFSPPRSACSTPPSTQSIWKRWSKIKSSQFQKNVIQLIILIT